MRLLPLLALLPYPGSLILSAQDTNVPSSANVTIPPSQTAALLVGSWVDQDPNARSMTQVKVRRDGERVLVHAWGSCYPTDCDWGEEVVELRNGIGVVLWVQGFGDRRMELIPQPDGRLRVTSSFGRGLIAS